MRLLTRRHFINIGVSASAVLATSGFSALASGTPVKFKVGVTDWNLKQEGKLEAVALAKSLGFDGVQVSIGKGTDSLPLADPALQKAYLDESKRVGLPVESLCLEVLHRNFLKSDPLGARWVADSVGIAKAMKVRVVLLPFFNNGALTNTDEMDKVGDILLGYSVSSSSVYPSVRFTGRKLNDAHNQMIGETSIFEGGGSQTSAPQWGPYTGMAIDPQDDCTFWYTNEYLATSGIRNWHTRIASMKFPNCH